MKNRILLICLLLIGAITHRLEAADAAHFSADAPKQVVMGQNFRLVYTANDELEDLRIPELSSYFDVIFGPSTSISSSTRYINGKYESNTSYGITYILVPKKTGTFNIPAATAKLGGQSIKSNTLTVTVLPTDKQSGGSGRNSASGQSQSAGTNSPRSTASVSNDQVFIRAIPSKTSVREQEGLLVTYKLYTRVDISGMQNPKFPEFKGFMAQEIDLQQNRQWDVENYNGLNYNTTILKQTVLYPQETGKLTISKGSFDLVLRVRTQSNARSIFDDFFDSYSDVKKTIYCNSLSINVAPLPAGKPANFSGVAGRLSMTSGISATKVKANEAVTIRVKVSGNGNLKMIPTPELTFPADFEVYDPKVDNSFKITTSGLSGTKTIEYLVIPRFPGTFEIPSVSISYYDLDSKTYKTLSTQAFTLEVGKGDGKTANNSGSYVNQEQLKLVGSDIRYLKKINRIKDETKLFFGTPIFWLAYLIPLLIFAVLILINRKNLKENADIAKLRNRKANKIAVKRLKQAHQYLTQGKQEFFYDEVLKALWGYTSDKLEIPLSRLNKETIDSQLVGNNVEDEIRQEFIEILDTSEYARFAPGDPTETMDKLYEKTMDVINKMESTLKR
jgi:hypothetical protein